MKTLLPIIIALVVLLFAGFIITNSGDDGGQAADQASSQGDEFTDRLISINAGDIYRYDAEGNIEGLEAQSQVGQNKLTRKDLSFLESIDNVEFATAFAAIPGEVREGNSLLDETILAGVGPNFLDVLGFNLDQGRFFTDDELDQKVAFVGRGITEMFDENPIGKTVKINNEEFEILGTMQQITISATAGVNFNNLVLIPLDQAEEMRGEEFGIQEVNLIASTVEAVPQIVEDARTHLLKTRNESEFTIISSTR